jgi:tungstate transport system permease protein
MIAGGAIEGYTSVLTTTIAVQTSMGNFEEALVLGLVLISLTLLTAILIKSLSKILAGAFHYE